MCIVCEYVFMVFKKQEVGDTRARLSYVELPSNTGRDTFRKWGGAGLEKGLGWGRDVHGSTR